MQCVICKHGELDTGTTTVTLERDGVTLVFKDVPKPRPINVPNASIGARMPLGTLTE